MKDVNLPLLNKGTFTKIDNQFIKEGKKVLQQVQVVQEKFHKEDTDTFINELRDSIAGHTLGFELVNVDKHGFDCKMKEDSYYLEVKSASFVAKSWQATFNDTTLEKAEAFKDKKVYLALAVWQGASDLLFICYGQNEKLGEYLEKKIKWFKGGHTVRSTQSISLYKLIFDFGFKILAVNKSKDEVISLLKSKNRSFKNMPEDTVISLSDFKGIQREGVK